jgi:predicted nucleic acid-binding Zn ribbon protein
VRRRRGKAHGNEADGEKIGGGVDGAPGPEKVGKLLGEFLEKKGLRGSVLQAKAAEEWDERVGEGIARVTRARGVRGGALVVEVRSSAWLMELNLMKQEILQRVNQGRQEAPIENIVFVLAGEGVRSRHSSRQERFDDGEETGR